MIIEGIVAAVVVVAAGFGRPWQRPLMAALLLIYLLRMPSIDFVAVWNPFALLLPTVLLLLLAARACAGSAVAFASSLLVLSFLLQTHVGTAPLVGLVGLVSAVALWARLRRSPELRPDARTRRWIMVAAAGTVVMWLPPLWQQLTARPHEGNLRALAGYVVHGGGAGQDTHTWREAVSSVGQMLGAPVFGWPAEPALLKTTILTPAVLAAVAVQLGGGIAVALVGRRLAERWISWLGAMTALGTVAALAAAKTVTGPMMNYLLLWVTVLPAVLLFAGTALLVAWWRAAPERLIRGLAAAGTACAVAAAVAVGVSFHRSAEARLATEPGADDASRLALAGLRSAGVASGAPVLLDIVDVNVWTTATDVALELEESGYHVRVERTWEYGFGWDRLATGTEQWRLSLAPTAPGRATPSGSLGTVAGLYGPETVALERAGR
jgi:hypothetical protein